MSRETRVEEVSDSDPDEMDPADFDPTPLPANHLISPANIPSSASSATRLRPQGAGSSPSSIYSPIAGIPAAQTQVVREIPKHYLCLYPVYFDRRRTRAEGRQVGMEHAVDNPLARDIVDAVQVLGLRVGFEPDKTHPKDWANPGRVRVLLRDENGRALGGNAAKNSTCFWLWSLRGWWLLRVWLTSTRTSSVYQGRKVSQRAPGHRGIAIPPANTRSSDP